MNCAIFFRSNGGALRVVTDADGQPREFADHERRVRVHRSDDAVREQRHRLADRFVLGEL
jgi:hypothetical protein